MAPQWSRPIVGLERVKQLLRGLARQMADHGVDIEPHDINGQPGAILRDRGGLIAFVWEIDIQDGRVHRLRSVINPRQAAASGPRWPTFVRPRVPAAPARAADRHASCSGRRMEDELDQIARAEIQERWDVLDADGERVGEVAEVHDTSFSLETTVGGSVEIDFNDVESADDGRVTLMMSGEELTSDLGE